MARFEAEGALVLGISVDYTASNNAWAESLGVQELLLLSDYWPHGQVAQDYGVLRPQGYAERAIFVVDKQGIISFAHVYDIEELPDNEDIFAALGEID